MVSVDIPNLSMGSHEHTIKSHRVSRGSHWGTKYPTGIPREPVENHESHRTFPLDVPVGLTKNWDILVGNFYSPLFLLASRRNGDIVTRSSVRPHAFIRVKHSCQNATDTSVKIQK